MIQYIGVSKIYKGTPAVKDVSFSIEEKEFVLLTGPSGSGKTTLLKMLIRDIKPTEGKIIVAEDDITRLRWGKIRDLRRKVGVVFQDFKLLDDKTAYENVAFALEANGKSDREIKDIIPYVLDIVGLKDKMKFFPKELSGGQQQKVAIARAIANDPQILIADEATGNLDEESTWEIYSLLSKINSWGTTILMATHDTEIIKKLNNRILYMKDGELQEDSSNPLIKKDKNEFENKMLDEKIIINQNSFVRGKKIVLEVDQKEENNAEEEKESKVVTKPKIKIGLSSKKKSPDTKETETKENIESVQKSSNFEAYNLSHTVLKLLEANKYKDMQDLLNAGSEKIENIEGISGDQIKEIENAINEFTNN